MSEWFSIQQKCTSGMLLYTNCNNKMYKILSGIFPQNILNTRNETVTIKKTITRWGVAIAHPDTI